MVSPNVNMLLRQAQSLSLTEREQFLELLKSQSDRQAPLADQKKVAALTGQGARITTPPKPTPEERARFQAWRPIEMPGGSLSDELIQDRR